MANPMIDWRQMVEKEIRAFVRTQDMGGDLEGYDDIVGIEAAAESIAKMILSRFYTIKPECTCEFKKDDMGTPRIAICAACSLSSRRDAGEVQ